MNFTRRTLRDLINFAVAAGTRSPRTLSLEFKSIATAVVLLVAAGAQPAHAEASATAAARACTGSEIAVWLGDGPGGATAGTTFFPIEFSNTSHHSCSLYGYPGVSAVSSSGAQVGKPAARLQQKARTVLLAPGITAHAILGIVDWGAVCRKGSVAEGLRVYSPGDRNAQPIDDFSLEVCANTSTLRIGAVSSGVGIPGYTAS